MKIVILDSLTVSSNAEDFKDIFALGDVTSYRFSNDDEVAERIADAEAVFCTKTIISDEVFEKCPNLRFIGLFATGYNNIDVESASRHNVTVCNVPAYSTDSVAQHTFALILHYFNNVAALDSSVRNGDWIRSEIFTYFDIPIYELSGMTLGIIGFGSIGRKVAQIALAFGMKVIASTRTVPENYPEVSFVSLDELLENSDVVSIHCPLTEQTKELICMETLLKMKKTALLINTSRGGIINENDLTFALNNDIIAAAGVDVISREPMLEDNPLRTAKNCFITPHVAWSPKTTRLRLLKSATENFLSWKNNSPKNVVNRGSV